MPRPLAHLLPVALAAALSACAGAGRATLPDYPLQVDDPGPRERLRVVTYNLHWPSTRAAARTEALLAELRAADADVIAIQELGGWFAAALAESGFVEEGGYAVANLGGKPASPHRLLLLSRFPIRTTLVRKLTWGKSSVLVTRLEINGRAVTFANVHLESRLRKSKVRVGQLREVLALLGEEEAILLGDFNFGDENEPERSTLPASFADAWRVARGDDPGLTWNRERNPWAKRNSYSNEPSRRIDRVLVRSPDLVPEEAALLGAEPTARGRFPSDHFGLVVTLRDRRGGTIAAPPER